VKVIPGTRGCKQVPRDLQENTLIDWKIGKTILEKYDILEQYKIWSEADNCEKLQYGIEPGCDYHELQGIIVPKQYVYIIEVAFWGGEEQGDDIVEYSCIYVK
jgi:hypothetical protein